MAWPDPPNVDLSGVIMDFERTTGRSLVFEWRWEQYPDKGSWICDYAVDGDADRGGIGTSWDDNDPKETLVRLADRLVEDSLSR